MSSQSKTDKHSFESPDVAVETDQTPRRGSIGRSLLLGFLFLALLPLCVVSLVFYQQLSQTLKTEVDASLVVAAEQNRSLLESWFDNRVRDARLQAELLANTRLLQSLRRGYEDSNQSLGEYLRSSDWETRVDQPQDALSKFSRIYEYIYDVFLIDDQGNILFTVERESDFGTSLIDGPYRDTRFAGVVRESLATGQTLLSDLERYAPSNDLLSAFLVTPMLSEAGERIGIFAIQLKLDYIASQFKQRQSGDLTVSSYIVGADGLLRTTLSGDEQDVLRRSVDTQVLSHQQVGPISAEHQIEEHLYVGPDNREVFGLANSVKLPGLDWTLVTEIDAEQALGLAVWFKTVALEMVVLLIVLCVSTAWWLTRRIVTPLQDLSDAALAVAAGESDQQVDVIANNEVGKLAETFNHMLEMRHIHEQALEQSNAEAQTALQALEDQKYAIDQHAIVVVTDVKGTITYANTRFAEISGYSVAELLGENHRIISSGRHDRQFWSEMFATLARGEVWHGEICNKAKYGDLYWVDTTIVPFMKAGKPHSYIAIRTDITSRIQSEMALQEAKESAESGARAKSEFLASMSHEIRTPMNGVIGMLGLLLHTDLNREQKHRAQLARSSAESLLHLINDILDFSKVEAGKLELEELDFNLADMLGEFAESIASRAQERHLEFVLDFRGIGETRVLGDSGRLRQILSNLVGNAIKFTHEGAIILRAALEHQNDELVFRASVIDSGIGIPEEKQKSLFEAFTQVDASTTREFGGTGLGLAIVKQLCQLMGGDIRVTSQQGQGSVFEFFVSLGRSPRSTPLKPDICVETLSVLVVDDSDCNRDVLVAQLQDWGVQARGVATTHQALELLKKEPMDSLLIDLNMPERSGESLCTQLQQDPDLSNLPRVMMTDLSNREDAAYFRNLGCRGHFPKPATFKDLSEALRLLSMPAEVPDPKTASETSLQFDNNGSIENDSLPNWVPGTRILLVEDNQVNQLVAAGMLEQLGLSCEVAGNGIEAIESMRQAPVDLPFHLVLMDCQMPEMDGFEATAKIRDGEAGEEYLKVPVVAMTANAMKGDREKCLEAGMDDYMSKPVEPDLLRAKMEKWLPLEGESFELPTIDFSATEAESDMPEECAGPDSIWDRDAALERLMGKESLLNAMLEVTLKDLPKQLSELHNARQAMDWTRMERAAHSIKGVAGNISATALQELAKSTEAAAREKDQRLFDEQSGSMQNQCALVMQRLEKELSVSE